MSAALHEVPRPIPLRVCIDGIPEAIRAEARWVVWSYVLREGKWTKPLYVATAQAQLADSTDPTTWRPFDDALGAYEDGKCDGIGFVLGDGWVGFDSDHKDAPEYRHILNSYSEYSPSGDGGIHTLCRGKKPGTKCRVGREFELYDSGRYFTVTGHHIPGTPKTVEERTAEIATLYGRLFPERIEHTVTTATSVTEDDALIAKAKTAKNGAKFTALWSGDTSEHAGDESAADLALCAMLAFWTNRDAGRMDRLFRRSGLARDKWDSRRGDSTWGANVIAQAIESTPKGYTGHDDPFKKNVELVCAKDVKVETLAWLNYGRFAYGAITLVEGGPEKGKSTVLCDYAARVSTGAPFPGESTGREPGNVVMLIAEDDIAATVVPRLIAANADLSHVFFLGATKDEKGQVVPFHLSDDCERLEAQCKKFGATFIVVDPLVSFLGSRSGKTLDSYNDMQVRKSLGPLKELAEHTRASIAAIRHYKKRAGTDALEAGGGSVGFTALVRVMIAALPNPHDENSYLLAVAKNNLVRKDKRPAILYQIVPSTTNPDIGCVQWGEAVEMSASDILLEQAKVDREANKTVSGRVAEATAFLEDFLVPGKPVKSADVFAAAKEQCGLTPAVVREAKAGMGVRVEKEAGKPNGAWEWIRESPKM
jgi:hypothetical protein